MGSCCTPSLNSFIRVMELILLVNVLCTSPCMYWLNVVIFMFVQVSVLTPSNHTPEPRPLVRGEPREQEASCRDWQCEVRRRGRAPGNTQLYHTHTYNESWPPPAAPPTKLRPPAHKLHPPPTPKGAAAMKIYQL